MRGAGWGTGFSLGSQIITKDKLLPGALRAARGVALKIGIYPDGSYTHEIAAIIQSHSGLEEAVGALRQIIQEPSHWQAGDAFEAVARMEMIAQDALSKILGD